MEDHQRLLDKVPVGLLDVMRIPGLGPKTVQLLWENADVTDIASLKTALEDYCRSRGIAINHFVQEALIDRLEELEDVEDVKRIRHEPTRPLAEVLEDLGIDGEV